jgi:hypothetical protein
MNSSERKRQQLQALDLANVTRLVRARLKREIGSGAVLLAEVLRDPPPEAEGCSLRELLMSQRGWGQRRCTRFLAAHEIGERKRLRELTVRQRELVGGELDRVSGPRPEIDPVVASSSAF